MKTIFARLGDFIYQEDDCASPLNFEIDKIMKLDMQELQDVLVLIMACMTPKQNARWANYLCKIEAPEHQQVLEKFLYEIYDTESKLRSINILTSDREASPPNEMNLYIEDMYIINPQKHQHPRFNLSLSTPKVDANSVIKIYFCWRPLVIFFNKPGLKFLGRQLEG
jgi:hypothetical protein